MQEENLFVPFLVCFCEAMVQAKIVGPGRRAKCLCPLHRLLKVALECPMPCADTGLHVSCAHA